MKKQIFTLMIVLIILSAFRARGQTPTSDAGWNLNTTFSEEFSNVTSLEDDTEWFFWEGTQSGFYNVGCCNCMKREEDEYIEFLIEDEDEDEIDFVRIKTEHLGLDSLQPQPYCPDVGCKVDDAFYDWKHAYKSTAISTFGHPSGTFKYGYFEARCRFHYETPELKPAFWLQAGSNTMNSYREIDVFEYEAEHPHYIPYNLHWHNDALGGELRNDKWYDKHEDLWGGIDHGLSPSANERLDEGWNTWGVEWNYNKINFFLNDELIRTVDINVPNLYMEDFYEKMSVFLSVGANCPDPSKTWSNFDIDFVNIYFYNMADCSDLVVIDEEAGNNFDFANNFQHQVIESAIFKNTSIPDNLELNGITIRFTDSVELESNFTVEAGRHLTIIPTPCTD